MENHSILRPSYVFATLCWILCSLSSQICFEDFAAINYTHICLVVLYGGTSQHPGFGKIACERSLDHNFMCSPVQLFFCRWTWNCYWLFSVILDTISVLHTGAALSNSLYRPNYLNLSIERTRLLRFLPAPYSHPETSPARRSRVRR